MNTQDVTIQSTQFTIPAPYLAGHTLTEVEAGVLNQTYAENIRNNFAAKIKKAIEDKTPVPDQAALDAYAAAYQFGVRPSGGPRVVRDPVESEARRMASKALNDALKAKGIKVKDMSDEQYEDLLAKALDKYPKFREQAKVIVAARNATVEGLDLGG